MAHWSDAYIGRPYLADAADCATLVCDVARDQFGVAVPAAATARAASALGRARLLEDLIAAHGARVAAPQEGDVALLRCAGRNSHVGVVCRIAGETWILHAARNAGAVVRHRLRDLAHEGLSVSEWIRWRL